MSGITTHVLDTARGEPARNVRVRLERLESPTSAVRVGEQVTDADGRARSLVPVGVAITAGWYRLVFDTGTYLRSRGSPAFFPSVTIDFEIGDVGAHYHVPLLLSPFGYSTYRGT
jgi:5-hydroxyisourate hydrolase